MQCQVCNIVKWNKRDWFKPQWQQSSPVVLNHTGGDFDRRKECYYNKRDRTPAPATQTDLYANLRVVVDEILRLQERLCSKQVRGLVEHWMLSGLVKHYSDDGAVTCELPTDPKQYVTVDGRWTFDARNRNYGKAFMLLWPDLRTNENDAPLGNIIANLLG